MRYVLGALFAAVIALAGSASSFVIGRDIGFGKGCEWALVQAEILARETGQFMPVSMKDGTFHVVIRQQRGLYNRTRQAADRFDNAQTPVPVIHATIVRSADRADETVRPEIAAVATISSDEDNL